LPVRFISTKIHVDSDRLNCIMRCNVLTQQIDWTERERLQCNLFRVNGLCAWCVPPQPYFNCLFALSNRYVLTCPVFESSISNCPATRVLLAYDHRLNQHFAAVIKF